MGQGGTGTPVEALPRRELLEALVRSYHRLQNEHKRAAPEGRVRRRIEDRLLDVRERFERQLVEWVDDDALREEWLRYLHNRAAEPVGPPAVHPIVFRGENEAGAVAEIRRKGGELAVTVDGTLTERLPLRDFPASGARVTFRASETDFVETFTASREALDQLAAFLAADDDGSPPWGHAVELLADGVIDLHFDVTPRGRRALGSADADV